MTHAQLLPYDWGIYNAENPLNNAHPLDYYHGTKNNMPYIGMGTFSLNAKPPILPQTLLHLYSSNTDVRYIQDFPPSTLRLQTAVSSYYDRTQHKASSIEFRTGLINDPQGKEEQLGIVQSFEPVAPASLFEAYSPLSIAPRGLSFSVQKTTMKGTEPDGMLQVMTMLSAYRKKGFINAGAEVYVPRIGIGTNTPLEHLHIGRRFTFHAGGISRIADNLYYDINKDISRIIDPGYASAITMYQGTISLGNSKFLTNPSDTVSFAWGDNTTFNGLTINPQGNIGIGLQYPQASIDIHSQFDDHSNIAMRIRNKQYGNVFHVTAAGNTGIYNAQPKERLHIGERLTLHAGGSSVIGDNIFFDGAVRSLQSGRGASLQFYQGRIQLANTNIAQNPHQMVSYQINSQDERTLRGISIEQVQGFCGIGKMYPSARLDIAAFKQDTAHSAMQIGTLDNDSYFAVSNQGNIGIGIAQPKQKLHVMGNVLIGEQWNTSSQCSNKEHTLAVDGAIIAREILVTDDSWADFVFDEQYKLDSLEFVEEYISKHKHLPGIPSQIEIQEQGVNISHIQTLLLQKIEELTLHIIQLHKQQKRLRETIDILPIQD